jgi:hypothetical protein
MIKKMNIGLHVKYRLFLSDFNEILIFSTDFRKTLIFQISWKSVTWEQTCSMRKDGRMDRETDMMKLIVAFSRFAKAPKTYQYSSAGQKIWKSDFPYARNHVKKMVGRVMD